MKKTNEILNLLETEVVENIDERIAKEAGVISQANDFVGMISLRHYFKLQEVDLDEAVLLLKKLLDNWFVIDKNPLFYSELSVDNFFAYIENEIGNEGIKMDYLLTYLLKAQLKGELNNLLENKLEPFDVTLEESLDFFVVKQDGMPIGDMPSLNLLFAIQKALVAKGVAKLNVKALKEGKTEVYKILPALQ